MILILIFDLVLELRTKSRMKTFLFAILILLSLNGIAQNDRRLVLGPFLSMTSTSLKAKPSIGDIDPQKGIGFGVFARLHILMLYAKIEGGFTSLKSESNLILPTGINSQTSYKLNGWDVNSYLGWRILSLGDIGNARVFIGYTFKDISKISIRSELPNMQNLSFDEKFKGIIFGAGVDVWKLTFDVNFTRGLKDIEIFSEQSLINNYSTISVGYKF
jgi:hypothetical protein